MTKAEFMGQFDRLCRGFRHDATPEQAEAWFKRLQHWESADWVEAVTTLLCAPKYPYLDAVVEALDEAQRARRHRLLQCERKQAERVYAEVQAAEGGPLSSMLFKAVKACGAREQVRRVLAMVQQEKTHRVLEPQERHVLLAQLHAEEKRLTEELTTLVPSLEQQDLTQFVARYGQAVAA